MKTSCWAILLSAWVWVAQAEIRDWTSADGRTLRAEFVKAEDGKVTIRRFTDGRLFTLDLVKLSEADQTWVKEHGAAAATDEPADGEGAAGVAADSPYHSLITGDWERHEDQGLEYRFYGERRLRSGGQSYPLVICLHGKNGDVMTPEAPWPANSFANKERRCFVLAPQAPKDNETWTGKNAEAVVDLAKDMLKQLPIDPNRIYLTGYSMGAYGTFHLLGREPNFFAAAVPVAGGGNPSQARSYRKVPIWVFHGAKDDVVAVEQSQQMVEALKKARSEVKYTEYPDGDHGIGGQVYGDQEMHEWLFAQAKS